MRNRESNGPPSKITRTAEGLRDVLFDEMDRLRNDRSTPARARSVALLANSILQSVVTEIEAYGYMAELANIANSAGTLGTLQLGGKVIEHNGD